MYSIYWELTWITVQSIATVVMSVAIIATAIFAVRQLRLAARSSIREATEAVYNMWWSDDLHELRRYFSQEFLPKYREQIKNIGLKEVEVVISQDRGRTRQLCYFYDRIGWLGAAGLIDVDYVLGAMQHAVRRTWLALESLIYLERQPRLDRPADPVYLYGFQWLFLRTQVKHQSKLVVDKLTNPQIVLKRKVKTFAEEIDNAENIFLARLTGNH